MKKKVPVKAYDLLYQLCQLAFATDGQSAQPNCLVAANFNWSSMVKLATQHKVIPLLYKGLNLWSQKELVPSNIMAILKQYLFQIATQNLFQSKSLIQIIKLFQEEGIKVIPYKGVILSDKAYQQKGMRRSSDLDLLIQFEDFEKVKTLLLANGFKENFVLPVKFEKNRIKYGCEYGFILQRVGQPKISIDLHWAVADKQQQLHLSYKDFIPFINQEKWSGLEGEFLSPEGLLLSTCIHHSKEQWNRLSYLTDMAALLNRYHSILNWSLLLEVAKHKKIENILYLGIGMTQNFIETPIPAIIQKGIQQKKVQYYLQKFNNKLFHQFLAPPNPLQQSLDKMWYQFSLRKKISTKLKILFYNGLTILLPNGRDIEGLEEHEISYWRLFFTKPFRLFRTIGLVPSK